MEHDHRRRRVHELQSVHALGHGRIRRQRMARAIAAPMPRHGHNWIDIQQKERGQAPMIDIAYVPTMCNHCDNAPCLAKGGDAVKKRDDGIVIIDPEKAKGRKDLVESCPYGHIWWNEELQLPQIWPFDAHLLDQGWQQTRGQQACPTGAMRAIKVEDEEMARMARDEQLEVMKPEAGTKPRVYYRNLWRYSEMLHRRQRGGRSGRRGRLRRGRERAPAQGRPDGRASRRPTTTATSSSTGSTRTPAATPSRFRPTAAPRCSTPTSASASISARSGCNPQSDRQRHRSGFNPNPESIAPVSSFDSATARGRPFHFFLICLARQILRSMCCCFSELGRNTRHDKKPLVVCPTVFMGHMIHAPRTYRNDAGQNTATLPFTVQRRRQALRGGLKVRRKSPSRSRWFFRKLCGGLGASAQD